MLVRILKPCYCAFLRRYVAPGEVVDCPNDPAPAIAAGIVEPVPLFPENVPDLYPD